MTRNISEADREAIRRDAIRECIDAIDAEATRYHGVEHRRAMNRAVESVRKLYDLRAEVETDVACPESSLVAWGEHLLRDGGEK